MKDAPAQRYHLIFAGQRLPDISEAGARQALADFFGLDDSAGVDIFFSGREVTLRRNLEHREAFSLYRQLRAAGLICEVRAMEESAPTAAPVAAQAAPITATPAPSQPKRGPAPNPFALRPTQGPPRQQVLERRRLLALLGAATCAATLLVLAAIALRFPADAGPPLARGPLALATLESSELVILTGGALLLHERSGIARLRIKADELGLRTLAPPLFAVDDDTVLLNGTGKQGATRLRRCSLTQRRCATFFTDQKAAVLAIARPLVDDNWFFLTDNGELWRTDSGGQMQSVAALSLPTAYPRIISRDGLLFVADPDGPFLRVYRQDAAAFGEQIDALLLQPALPTWRTPLQLRDVVVGDTARWTLLASADAPDRHARLLRLDNNWGVSAEHAIAPPGADAFLLPWRDKLLLAGPGSPLIQRYSATGRREADFDSTLLRTDLRRQEAARRSATLWRRGAGTLGLGFALVAGLFALCNWASYLGQTQAPLQRTALLYPMPAGIHWLAPDRRPLHALQRLTLIFCLTVLVGALGLLALGRDWQAAALIPALIGGAAARRGLRRSGEAYLGVVGDRCIAVDCDGHYFYGGTSHLRRSALCVFAPGVVLCGPFPDLEQTAAPTGESSDEVDLPPERIDPLQTLGLLWERRHPLLLGVASLFAASALTFAALWLRPV